MKEKIDFDLLSYDKIINAPVILTDKFNPPVKFTKDPMKYWIDPQYLGIDYLSKNQKTILEKIFANWPNIDYDEVVMICGQRSGKTSIFGGPIFSWYTHYLLSFNAFDGESPQAFYGIDPATTLYLTCIACSKEQSEDTIFASYDLRMKQSPFWTRYNQWLKDLELSHRTIRFPNANGEIIEQSLRRHDLFNCTQDEYKYNLHNISIRGLSTNSASAAGKTSIVVAFDEISRLLRANTMMVTGTQRQTAEAIVQTMKNSLATLGTKSMFLAISSPQSEDDYGIELLTEMNELICGPKTGLFEEFIKGRNQHSKSARSLGVHMDTEDMLNLDDIDELPEGKVKERLYKTKDFLDNKRNVNPDAYERDFGARPTKAMDRFFVHHEKFIESMRAETNFFNVRETVNSNGNLHTTSLQIINSNRSITAQFPYFIHADPGKSRNSFAIVGAYAEPICLAPSGNPFLDFDNAVAFRTVVDFVLEWIPGVRYVNTVGKKANVDVDFNNVLETSKTLLYAIKPQIFTFDHWNSAIFIQTLSDMRIGKIAEVSLSLNDWDEFKMRLYHKDQLFRMVNDKDNENKSRSYDQLKKAVQKGNNVDFIKSTDGSHGDIICCLCAVDKHIREFGQARLGHGGDIWGAIGTGSNRVWTSGNGGMYANNSGNRFGNIRPVRASANPYF